MNKPNFSTRVEQIKTLVTDKPKSKITNQRQELIGMFVDRLNLDRKPPYKPLTAPRVGMMLAALDTRELYVFLAELKQSKHFSKSFWWRINPKNYA